MEQNPELERFVSCSEPIVVNCLCGERLILLGQEEDWYTEGRTVFTCRCGRELTLAARSYNGGPILADQDGEETPSIRELLRRLKTSDGQ